MSTTVNYKGSEIATVSNETKTLTTAGTWMEGDIELVDVSASAPVFQEKTATPTESTQTIVADNGYDGLSSVEIGAISSTYIGSGITTRSSSDLTVSGATVTAPSGYYSSDASASIASGSATTPATTITANPSISISDSGLITASASASQNVAPTVSKGYVSSGTAGKITVSGSDTLQLTTQGVTTITPTESTQTAVASGVYTTGEITVDAISSTYVGSDIASRSSDNLSVSGATVTAPAGYYAESASKTISSGSAKTPATTITVDPTITVSSSGLITATASANQNITPTVSAGYVASGTAGTITVNGSDTLQLTTQDATTITPTTSSQTAVAKNVYTLGAVTVSAVPTETKTVTENGDVTPSSGKFLSKVTVNVPTGSTINNQDKSVSPTESSQSITADSGYTGLGTVTVGAISSTYIGSDITTDPTPTASGATVTIPTGFYSEDTTKSVASGSATTPETTITANPSISVSSSGLITASTSTSKSITPAVSKGYVSSGTAGTVTVSGSNTSQLTTLGATTYNTSTSDQTIASGKYLIGTQTIKAVKVSGLDASKIASGTTVMVGDANDADRIVSVTGTLNFVTYYTGTSDPSSSIGSDGDIYLKVVS